MKIHPNLVVCVTPVKIKLECSVSCCISFSKRMCDENTPQSGVLPAVSIPLRCQAPTVSASESKLESTFDSTQSKWDLHMLNAGVSFPTSSLSLLNSVVLAHSQALLSLKRTTESLEESIIMFISSMPTNATLKVNDIGTSQESIPTSDESETFPDGLNTLERKIPSRSKRGTYPVSREVTSPSPEREIINQPKKSLQELTQRSTSCLSPVLGKTLGLSRRRSIVASMPLVPLKPIRLSLPVGTAPEPVLSSPDPPEPEKPSLRKRSSPRCVEHFSLSGTSKPSKRTRARSLSSSMTSTSRAGKGSRSSISSTVKTNPRLTSSTPCVPLDQESQDFSQPIDLTESSSPVGPTTPQ
nr:MAG TPA: hypothetical protein [Cressdnaviricota sp.]